MPDSDVSLALLRLAWRVDTLEEWRKTVEDSLGVLETGLREIVNADEIEKAVRAGVRSERTLGLTFVQKAAIFVVAVLTAASSIKGLVG